MNILQGCLSALVGLGLSSVLPDMAQSQIVAVGDSVALDRAADAEVYGARTELREGDVLETGLSGLAEITLRDGTRLALGPQSRLRVRTLELQVGGVPRRVDLDLERGSLRVIPASGNGADVRVWSAGREIEPRAGLVDVVAGGPAGVSVALEQGEVLTCSGNGSCVVFRGQCIVAVPSSSGEFGLFGTGPSDRLGLLRDSFPLVLGQDLLAAEFRFDLGLCGWQQPGAVAAALPRRSGSDGGHHHGGHGHDGHGHGGHGHGGHGHGGHGHGGHWGGGAAAAAAAGNAAAAAAAGRGGAAAAATSGGPGGVSAAASAHGGAAAAAAAGGGSAGSANSATP